MRYKFLGKSGLRVSEICLGTMTFGQEWGTGSNQAESRQVFDAFVEAGGNFLDTANRYTEGTSEKFLAEFMGHERHKFVLATKYALYTNGDHINDGGNHRKNLMHSIEGSLKRLKTDYIDLFYVHAWDGVTPTEEIMRALDDLVSQGKILYLGVSDTPAWVVSQANMLAELRGWTRFVGLQVEYSLVERTPERELIPMAKASDMAILGWAPMAAGLLTGKYFTDDQQPRRMKPDSQRMTPFTLKVAQETVKIAQEIGCTPAQLAIAWVKAQYQQIIPIVGARRLEQLKDNLESLNLQIPQEAMQKLNEVSQIELGFPHDFLKRQVVKDFLFSRKYELIDNHRLGLV